jgi:ribonuclease HI
MIYYAVFKGTNRGIYESWAEAKNAIKGSSKPIYRKFEDYEQAIKFYENGPQSDDDGFILETRSQLDGLNNCLIFTDGGCINNGKKNSKAAYGVYFGDKHILNKGQLMNGQQTNNSAELTGIIYALANIHNLKKMETKENSIYCIVTDSDYCIKIIKKYMKNDKSIEKALSKISNIPNEELIREIYNLIFNNQNINLDDKLKFIHVYSHTGKTDILSLGNEQADKLVREGLGIQDKPENRKIYLNVAYCEKDDAKSYGAKWDMKKKKWYINDNHEEIRKTYLINKYSIEL